MSIAEKLRQGVTTGSAEETRALAAKFAATLPPDTTLALHGDMGVGKTTFVQGLAQGLGVHEHVTSPTFAIYSIYRAARPAQARAESATDRNGAARTLVHLDAYRLENEHQVEELLLDEFLISPWVLAVEWPDKIGRWLPANTRHLTLSIVDGEHHRLQLR